MTSNASVDWRTVLERMRDELGRLARMYEADAGPAGISLTAANTAARCREEAAAIEAALGRTRGCERHVSRREGLFVWTLC